MKNYLLLLVTLVLLLAAPLTASAHPQTAPTGESIGSLPTDPPAVPPPQVVKKGEQHTNGDGATVKTDEKSGGNAIIDPKDGDEGSDTTVRTKTGWKGEVINIDASDTVELGSSSTGTIYCTGGTIVMAGGCNIRVVNAPHSPEVVIEKQDGTIVLVGPNSSTGLGDDRKKIPPPPTTNEVPPVTTSNEPATQTPPTVRVSEHAEQMAA